MPIYKINGEEVSAERLAQEAHLQNMSFDEYLETIEGLEISQEEPEVEEDPRSKFHVTPEELKGDESDVSEALNEKFARLGISTTEGISFGSLDALNLKNSKDVKIQGSEFSDSILNLIGDPTKIFSAIGIGENKTPEELAEAAAKINTYIDENGDFEFLKKARERSQETYDEYVTSVTPPEISTEELQKKVKGERASKFQEIKNKLKNKEKRSSFAGKSKKQTAVEDFDSQEEFEAYKKWVKDGYIADLSEEELVAYDQKRKNKYTLDESIRFTNGLDPDKRMDVLALATEDRENIVNFGVQAQNVSEIRESYYSSIESYKKNPTQANYTAAKAQEVEYIEKQGALQAEQKRLIDNGILDREKAIPIALMDFNRDYNRSRELRTKFKQFGTDIAYATAQLGLLTGGGGLNMAANAHLLTDPFLMSQTVDEITGLVSLSESLDKEAERYQRSIAVDEIRSIGDAGRWAAGSAVNLIPSLAMAATGPLAMPLFALSGAGGKGLEIAKKQKNAAERLIKNTKFLEENPDMDEFAKSFIDKEMAVDKEIMGLSAAQVYSSQALHGIGEVVFERFGTISLWKNLMQGIKMLPPHSIKEGAAMIAKILFKGARVEGGTEWLTTLWQNYVDIMILNEDKNVFEGGLESFAQGALMGSTMAGATLPPSLRQGYISVLKSKEETTKLRDALSALRKLTNRPELSSWQDIEPLNLNLSKEVQESVDDLMGEMRGIEDGVLYKVGSSLSPEQAYKVEEKNRQMRLLNKRLIEAVSNPNIGEEQLKAIKGQLDAKFNKLAEQREDLLADEADTKKTKDNYTYTKFSLDNTTGWWLYDTKMLNNSYLTTLGNYAKQSPATKQEGLDIARKALEKEGQKDPSVEDIKSRAMNDYVDGVYRDKIKEGQSNAEKFSKATGLNVEIETFEGNEADGAVMKWYKDHNPNATDADLAKLKRSLESGNFEGANFNGKIIVHLDNSIKNRRIGVYTHEVLHSWVKEHFKKEGQEGIDKAGEALLGYLKKNDADLYTKVKYRVDQSYTKKNAKGEVTEKGKDYYEEVMNAMSDVLADGHRVKESSLSKIRGFVNATLGKLPSKFRFKEDQGRGTYEFVKGYNKSSHFGGKIIEGSPIVKDTDVPKDSKDKTSEAKPKLSVSAIEQKLDELDRYDFDDDAIYESEKANLELKLKIAKKKEASGGPKKKVVIDEKSLGSQFDVMVPEGTTKEEYRKNIAGKVGEKITDGMLDPLIRKLAARWGIVKKDDDFKVYDKTMDEFVKDVISEQFIRNIMNYDPTKPPKLGLGWYIIASAFGVKNRVKEALARGKKAGDLGSGTSLDKAGHLTTREESAPQKAEGKKYKSLTNSNVVPNFTVTAIKDKLTSIVEKLESKITDAKGDNAATTPIIKELFTAIGKVKGDDGAIPKLIAARFPKPINTAKEQTKLDRDIAKINKNARLSSEQKKDKIEGLNKTFQRKVDGSYQSFLIKNKKVIIENMTTTYLMGKDTGKIVKGGIPMALEKSVGGEYTDRLIKTNIGGKETTNKEFIPNFIPYPAWVGKKIDREKTLVRGATAGNEIVRRVPADKVSDEDFVAQFVGENYKVIPGRRESISKAIGEEVALEAFSKEIRNENSPISKALKDNQEAKGAVLSSTFVVELSRDIDRGLVKLSETTGVARFDDAKRDLRKYLKAVYGNAGPLNLDIVHQLMDEDGDLRELVQILVREHVSHGERLRNKTLTKKQLEHAEKFEAVGNTDVNTFLQNIIRRSQSSVVAPILGVPSASISTFNMEVKEGKEPGDRRKKIDKFLPKYILSLVESAGKTGSHVGVTFIRTLQAALAHGKKSSVFGTNAYLFSQIEKLRKDNPKIDKAFEGITLGKAEHGGTTKTFLKKGEKVTTIKMQEANAPDFDSLFDPEPENNADIKGREAGSDVSSADFINFIKYLKGALKRGDIDLQTVGLLLNSLGGSMRSPAKTLAKLKGAFIVEGLVAKDYTFEHGTPTQQLLGAAALYIIGKGSTITHLENVINKSSIYIIPKKIAKAIDAFYKSNFSEIGALEKGSPEYYRYFFTGKAFQDYLGNLKIYNFKKENLTDLRAGGPVKVNPNLSVSARKNHLGNKAIEAVNIAIKNSLSNKPAKGISVWDFDDTLARTKSNVLYTMPDGSEGKLNAAEFAAKSDQLLEQGAEFDFSEFSKVMKGKKGPMFDKAIKRNEKFGNDHVYILTARPANSRDAIHSFLKGIGLDIKVDNIIGLADGNPQAKADWMVTKAAEGYNDFYFADDHTGNTKAVKAVLNVLDVKSKVVQAKIKFSQSLDQRFNKIIQRKTGVNWEKEFSEIVSRRLGARKGRWRIFVPPSADDFRGLTQYTLVGRGKQGESDQKFFERSLMNPYFEGVERLNVERQRIKDGTKALFKLHPEAKNKLRKLTANKEFTNDQAVRVYLWNKAGHTIPGISEKDQAALVAIVNKDKDLWNIANGVMQVAMVEEWTKPSHYWDAQTLLSDIDEIASKVNRKKYLAEFIENVDVIFSDKNLNKVEALFGLKLKDALKGSIQAMKSGSNRSVNTDRITNRWMNWINNSIGAIMFFNRRSATLQTLSIVNFINWSDNNPAKAAAAFANQKQYWSDFVMIFNSAKMKQRRSGLKSDVQEAEIANAAATSGNKPQAVISYLLKIGFTPTQIVDSFAISAGGATFYRNRLNTYLERKNSEGGSLYTEKQAKKKAWLDFIKIADATQQSGDPALVSQEQRSVSGRLLLAFQNTSMQYTRLVKKAGLDLINGRGDVKAHISKMIYYSTIQGFLFNALSNSLFALLPGFDEDDEDDDEKRDAKKEKKLISIYNGMLDSVLKGSGMYGAIVVGIKNTIRKGIAQEEAGWKGDHAYTIIEALNVAPAIGSKFRKGYGAYKTYKWNKDLIEERPWDITMGGRYSLSPTYEIIGGVSSAAFNLPLDRVIQESQSIGEALDQRNSAMQRMALAMGWKTWHVGAEDEEKDLIHTQIKTKNKEKKAEKKKAKKEKEKQAKIDSIANLPAAEKKAHYARIKAKRSASAKKAAATRKRNKEAKEAETRKMLEEYLMERNRKKK